MCKIRGEIVERWPLAALIKACLVIAGEERKKSTKAKMVNI